MKFLTALKEKCFKCVADFTTLLYHSQEFLIIKAYSPKILLDPPMSLSDIHECLGGH